MFTGYNNLNNGASTSLGTFDGDEVISWTSKFDLLLVHRNIPSERWTLELLVSLSGRIFKIVQEAGFDVDSSYGEIKKYLIARFGELKDSYVAQREFSDCKQKESQTIVEFAEEIRRKGKVAYGNMELSRLNIILKNQFIHGICSNDTRKHLLVKSPDTLEDAFILAQKLEFAVSRSETFSELTDGTMNHTLAMKTSNMMEKILKRLEALEEKKKQKVKCFNCGKEGHIKKHCFNNVISQNKYSSLFFLCFKIADESVEALIDTGSQSCIMKYSLFNSLGLRELYSTNERLFSAGGEGINIKGVANLDVCYGVKKWRQRFYVVEKLLYDCVLGMDALENLDIKLDVGNKVFRPKGCKSSQTMLLKLDCRSKLNNAIHHKINTGENTPIRDIRRRIPHHRKTIMAEMIADMLERDIIENSTSEWASNPIIVPKKSGKFRLCIDYRKLNNATVKDAYPLPRIDDILDMIGDSKYYTVLDLKDGYHQIPIDPVDKQKTAFYGVNGIYQYKMMPFGLCNAPATFQRFMNRTLQDFVGNTCLVYLDDIIIFSKTLDSHERNVKEILETLSNANLKINLEKSIFSKTKVKFLGHLISGNTIQPDPEKTEVIKNWPKPSNVKELQRFLGLANYYRRFVKGFSSLAIPMYDLLKKGSIWRWDKKCEDHFSELKLALFESVRLNMPNFNQSFVLDTDASNESIGGILSQIVDGIEKPVAFASRSLINRERNYCTTRKEMLALVNFIKYFKTYLLGKKFTVRTDHNSLKWLLSFKNPEGQVARWLEQLAEYDFEVIHRPGKDHVNADAVSRISRNITCSAMTINGIPMETIKTEQRHDTILKQVINWLEDDVFPVTVPKTESKELDIFWMVRKSLDLVNGILYRRVDDGKTKNPTFRLVIPSNLKDLVLSLAHDNATSGHLGHNKVIEAIKDRFYWPCQRKDIRNWCESCTECATRNRLTKKFVSELTTDTPSYSMERIAIDIVGPLERSNKGNRYIFVVQDYFTKWAEAFAIKNQEASTIGRKLVKNVFVRFGIPKIIHTDQGANFESKLFHDICSLMDIKKTRTCPYNPKSDGMVERLNRTIIDMLSKCANTHSNWDELLPLVMMAYRSATHSATKYTPNFLCWGRRYVRH